MGYVPTKAAVVFGGVKINPQMMKLRKGLDVLVATPGRLMDLYQQNAVRFNEVEIRAGRSRPHARHGLYPRYSQDPGVAAGQAPEPAVLRHLLQRNPYPGPGPAG